MNKDWARHLGTDDQLFYGIKNLLNELGMELDGDQLSKCVIAEFIWEDYVIRMAKSLRRQGHNSYVGLKCMVENANYWISEIASDNTLDPENGLMRVPVTLCNIIQGTTIGYCDSQEEGELEYAYKEIEKMYKRFQEVKKASKAE